MAKTKYVLRDQVHLRADTPNQPDVIITLQHWVPATGDAGRAVFVTTYNGVERVRKFCTTTEDLARIDQSFTDARREHADGILSEEAAADEVIRRNGPPIRWCLNQKCAAQIPVPFAADQCAEGHPIEGRGRVEFLSLATNNKVIANPLVPITGGK
jgi:hypothetical protein